MLKVSNLLSSNGNYVPNQFEIVSDDCITFQSYRSRIAEIKNGKVKLSANWDYSNTTSKYLYSFLRDHGFNVYSKKDVLAKIKNNEFKLGLPVY